MYNDWFIFLSFVTIMLFLISLMNIELKIFILDDIDVLNRIDKSVDTIKFDKHANSKSSKHEISTRDRSIFGKKHSNCDSTAMSKSTKHLSTRRSRRKTQCSNPDCKTVPKIHQNMTKKMKNMSKQFQMCNENSSNKFMLNQQKVISKLKLKIAQSK